MDWSTFLFACTLLGVGTAEFPLERTSIASLPAAGSEDYRLPGNIVPIEYNITVEPLFENFDDGEYVFNGNVTILAEALEDIYEIVLHAVDLTFGVEDVVVTSEGNPIDVTSVTWNDEIADVQTVTIGIGTITNSNTFTIDIEYSGILNDDDIGFYRAVYKNELGIERYLYCMIIFKRTRKDVVHSV